MVSWFENDQNFFGLTTAPDNNVNATQFESGKSRYILRNSSPKLTHTFSFLLRNSTKEKAFLNWYSNTLLSRTQTVGLLDLVDKSTTKEYRMTEEPNINGSQYPKEVTITVREE